MSANAQGLFRTLRVAQAGAIGALMGASFLASPLQAQTQAAPGAMHQDAMQPPEGMHDTVELRIGTLRAELQITPEQDAEWAMVAQTMRENESDMQKLVAERAALDPAHINALEDLKWYERFAKAHVGGLRKLIASFETLYVSMPEPQKAIADHVFKTFGRRDMHPAN